MDIPRAIAGVFCGSGALLLIYKGKITEGVALLSAMLGFFIGERNGQRTTEEKIQTILEKLES